MALATYVTGQRNFKIPYDLGRMTAYVGGGLLIFGVSELLRHYVTGTLVIFLLNTFLLVSYIALVWLIDRKNLKALLRF